jgi:hypothetical protein
VNDVRGEPHLEPYTAPDGRSVTLRDFLRQFRNKRLTIWVEVERRSLTRRQQRWYRGPILKALRERTGEDTAMLHLFCLGKFLDPPEFKQLAICDVRNGLVVEELTVSDPPSTTKLSTVEMADFCDSIREWAAQVLDLSIPDPDPNYREDVRKARLRTAVPGLRARHEQHGKAAA